MSDTAPNNRRRNFIIAIVILIIIAILLLLFSCPGQTPSAPAPRTTTQPSAQTPPPPAATGAAAAPMPPTERLDPATLSAPAQAPAGSTISITWQGPDNPGDYITIVTKETPATTHGAYQETKLGKTLQLTAPTSPGPYELRYLTSQSHTILGRAPIEITPVTAALETPDQVILGSTFTITWTGPDNKGDYITIIDKDAPDSTYASYAETAKGKSLTLTAPPNTGDYEVRYITDPGGGQQKKVLARRPIKVLAPAISLNAPDTAVAGSTIQVTWTGPNNAGDYITIVPKQTPDNQYGNYTDCSKGSPLGLLTPIMPGQAEIRYATSSGNKVLARRAITLTAPTVTLSAPAESGFDTDIQVTWTGPNYAGDYITVVPKPTPDGQYGPYTLTDKGSPLTVRLPKVLGGEPGGPAADFEVRYMTGQGNKVLARIPIKIKQ